MMIEWWSEEGHCDLQVDKKKSKYHANELVSILGSIPKYRNQ